MTDTDTVRDEIDYLLRWELGSDVNFYKITDDILKIFKICIEERLDALKNKRLVFEEIQEWVQERSE